MLKKVRACQYGKKRVVSKRCLLVMFYHLRGLSKIGKFVGFMSQHRTYFTATFVAEVSYPNFFSIFSVSKILTPYGVVAASQLEEKEWEEAIVLSGIYSIKAAIVLVFS